MKKKDELALPYENWQNPATSHTFLRSPSRSPGPCPLASCGLPSQPPCCHPRTVHLVSTQQPGWFFLKTSQLMWLLCADPAAGPLPAEEQPESVLQRPGEMSPALGPHCGYSPPFSASAAERLFAQMCQISSRSRAFAVCFMWNVLPCFWGELPHKWLTRPTLSPLFRKSACPPFHTHCVFPYPQIFRFPPPNTLYVLHDLLTARGAPFPPTPLPAADTVNAR